MGPREADRLVGQVYGEVKRDFALLRDPDGNSPFLAHSPHPELLAGMWSVLYETILVDGTVRRADKEAIGATVSRINDCPFCAESHALLSGVAGQAHDRGPLISGAVDGIADQRRRELVAWAAGTREPHSELVRSPLHEAGLGKQEIRASARELGLPNWDKPALACLSSRVPYGERVTPEKLARIGLAEEALRALGFRQLRVRHFADRARVEIAPDELGRVDAENLAGRIEAVLLALGFPAVEIDPRGYRSGRLNEGVVPLIIPSPSPSGRGG